VELGSIPEARERIAFGGHAAAGARQCLGLAVSGEEAMNRTLLCAFAVSFAVAMAAGVSPGVLAADDEVKPVAPPANMVGKWRVEVKEGKASRTSVYHFKKDGTVEVDVCTETPDRKSTVLVKRAIIKVEQDRITFVEISHAGENGVEETLPAERRKPRRSQTEVKGDELRLTEVDENGKPLPDRQPSVLKRVKE
jgi:hypothetical protein